MTAPPLKQLPPAKVFLLSLLTAICLGLLFEGVMIGPEYQRYEQPHPVLTAA